MRKCQRVGQKQQIKRGNFAASSPQRFIFEDAPVGSAQLARYPSGQPVGEKKMARFTNIIITHKKSG